MPLIVLLEIDWGPGREFQGSPVFRTTKGGENGRGIGEFGASTADREVDPVRDEDVASLIRERGTTSELASAFWLGSDRGT